MKTLIGMLGVIFLAVYVMARVVGWFDCERNINEHLERAARAAAVETADRELKYVIEHIQTAQLTSGYTSVFYEDADENLELWYVSLLRARAELREVIDRPDAPANECVRALARLRQAILVRDRPAGYVIKVPLGISIFPYNGLLAFVLVFGFVLIMIASGLKQSTELFSIVPR